MDGVNRGVWILALNGDGIFSPGFVAAIEAAGWCWMTVPDARDRLMDAGTCCLALLSIDHFTAATYDLIRFVAGALDLPIVVFSPAASLLDVCESLRAGAEDFIAIPYAPEEAIARLKSVLNGRYRNALRTPRSAHLRTIRYLRVACRHLDPDRSERSAAGGERQ